MFHNDTKVLARLDRIEASQLSTEGIVTEFRNMFKGLEKELCETMTSFVASQKTASGESRHELGCSEVWAHVQCCTKCRTGCGVIDRRVCDGSLAAKKQNNNTHHHCCCAEPADSVQDNGKGIDCLKESKSESSPVVVCPTSCEEQVLINCTSSGSQSTAIDEVISGQCMHAKKPGLLAWEVISTLRSVSTLCEAKIFAHQGQDDQVDSQNFELSVASAHLSSGSGDAENTRSSKTRSLLEKADSTRRMPDNEQGCDSPAFKTDSSDSTAALQRSLRQPSTHLSSPKADAAPAATASHLYASDCCLPGDSEPRVDSACSCPEQSPPSTPLSGSTQSWSPRPRARAEPHHEARSTMHAGM